MLQVKVLNVTAHSLSFDGITPLIIGQYNCQMLGCTITINVNKHCKIVKRNSFIFKEDKFQGPCSNMIKIFIIRLFKPT